MRTMTFNPNRMNTLFLLLALLASLAAAPTSLLANSPALPTIQEAASSIRLPLTFFATPARPDTFQALTSSGPVQFSASRLLFAQAGVQLAFEGASPAAALSPGKRLPGVLNYFAGSDPSTWQTGLPTFGGIQYRQLYPGIDVHYESVDGQLKSTYTVAPGADASQIRWRYTGGQVRLETGNLVVRSSRGASESLLVEQAPVAWQVVDGRRMPVEAAYTISAAGAAGFSLGAYDRALPLVIDPVLSYSSYLAGTLADDADTVAVDGAGNAYIAGSTFSTDFLGESGTSGTEDIWVMKLNPAGSAAAYITFLVGNDMEQANDIAVDSSGSVYLLGTTTSTNFPTLNPVQASNAGGFDFFATRLNTTGGLAYSTYLGSLYVDDPQGIAVDSLGQAHLVGQSMGSAVIYKLAANGSLRYLAFFGGDSYGETIATGVSVNQAGEVYLTGMTSQTDIATTPGAHQTLCDDSNDPYRSCRGDIILVKLNSANSFQDLQVLYSSYYGGISEDRAEDLALGTDGSVYITGKTISVNFPTSSSAYAKTCPSGTDPSDSNQCKDYEAFVTRFAPNLSSVTYSTYYGSSAKDFALAIDTDTSGAAYITGWTEGNSLPLVQQLQGHGGGICYTYWNYPRLCIDAFVASFNSNGGLVYSTFMGGGNDDFANDIAVSSSGEAYLVGNTLSIDYPTTSASLQPDIPGPGKQGMVTKISLSSSPPPPPPPPPPPGDYWLYLPLTVRQRIDEPTNQRISESTKM